VLSHRGQRLDGRERTGHDPGDPASRQHDRFGEELAADLAPVGAQCAPEPDLAAPLEHRHDHRVGHPDPTDQQRHPGEAEEQPGERVVGGAFGRERVGRPGNRDGGGIGRVDGGREDGADRLDVGLVGLYVDDRWVAVATGPSRPVDRTRGWR
jgi:hypothetical protein